MSSRLRIDHEPAYLLHSYPWRETSLIVEMFSCGHGRVPMVAKGARRTGSALRGTLMAFQPLSVSWSGKGEVKTLVQAEWLGGQALLGGVGLLCAYYLNELLLRLLPREDAHEPLFGFYATTLARLAAGEPYAPLLRAFELNLLRELGYAPTLDHDVDTGQRVRPDAQYLFLTEQGPVEHDGRVSEEACLPGHVLLAMAVGDFSASETLAHAKGLMRKLIQRQLGGQVLESRRILIELQEL